MRWLVDASNVIGSVPDGWWRDREGAARRLIERLQAFASETGDPVTVVLDAGPAELAGRSDGVAVVLARRRGRDAADDEIVRLLEAHEAPAEVTVATSDAALADRVRALGAGVEGAKTFRGRLE
jgi:predicted RNA-binding protein with PIN domain